MKLPPDSLIPTEKITRYLLVPLARGDKSAFLARGGYFLENSGQLLADLQTQVLPQDAAAAHENKFGRYFEVAACYEDRMGLVSRCAPFG